MEASELVPTAAQFGRASADPFAEIAGSLGERLGLGIGLLRGGERFGDQTLGLRWDADGGRRGESGDSDAAAAACAAAAPAAAAVAAAGVGEAESRRREP